MEYTIRKLNSNDIFPMFTILSKIGIGEVSEIFKDDDLKELVMSMRNKETSEEDSKNIEQSNRELTTKIGMNVIFKIVNLLMKNLPKVKNDLYKFLSGLSGIDAEQIGELPPAETMQMLIDVFKQDEFMDFIQVVSKLFK